MSTKSRKTKKSVHYCSAGGKKKQLYGNKPCNGLYKGTYVYMMYVVKKYVDEKLFQNSEFQKFKKSLVGGFNPFEKY